MLRMRLIFAWSALFAAAVALMPAAPASAAYKLCALRSGPSGPCTCVSDKPGEYVTAPSHLCKKSPDAKAAAKPAPAKTEAAAQPSPAPAKADAPLPSTEKPQAGGAAPETPSPEPSAPPPAATKEAAAPVAKEETKAPSPAAKSDGQLAKVQARGKLLCGINPNLLGFSIQNASGQWVGIDADFCRAVAAAIFSDAAKVEFVPLETNERFEALKTGKIDILSRNTTWTMNREVEMGLEFAGVLYFDGQGFMTSDERGLVSAQQLSGAKVCVEQGTTSEDNMAFYFKAHQIEVETKSFASRADLLKAYSSGQCDAVSGDRSSLFSDRAAFKEPAKHAVLPEVISKEPLGPAVLSGDRKWAETVKWTLAGLINAEEVGLSKASAASSEPPKADVERLLDGAGHNGESLGLPRTWLKDAVAAVGNYGEMFETNLGKASPLGMDRGINALWKRGGIVYAPPMW